MEKPNDMERAVDLADILTTTSKQEEFKRAREELERFTNPYAIEFLQAVMDEFPQYRIAG